MTYSQDTPIGTVVSEDFRTAAVFRKFGFDFWCGGQQLIIEACNAKGLDPSELLRQLDTVRSAPPDTLPAFQRWDPDLIVDYIVENHHRYVRQVVPAITLRATKVGRAHGRRRPELLELGRTFERLTQELAIHMDREERLLFPYIKRLSIATRTGPAAGALLFGSARTMTRLMENEHLSIGANMDRIRLLSGNYTLPDDADATDRRLFQELEAFEIDLQTHLHLENNILFPQVIALEGQ